MKLYYASASPYARKVRVAALEKSLELELIAAVTAEDPPALHQANPVGKIPALVTDDGRTLAESMHICLYLDRLRPEPPLLPQGARLFDILRRDALCTGVMDAAVRCVIESRRPAALQSPAWVDRQVNAILRTLTVLEAESGGLSTEDPLTLDRINLATALDYLDLRLPQLGWRNDYPRLAGWLRDVADRRSLRETQPDAPRRTA